MAWFAMLLQFFPVVLQIVTSVEVLLKGVPGPAKKAVALAVLNPPAALLPQVGALIDTTVAALNKAKAFPPAPVLVP
jgi:hypothetical protein